MFLALLFSVMLNVITGRYIYMYVFGFVILCYVKCNHRTLYTCMFLAVLFSVMLNVITGHYIYMHVFGFVIFCYVKCNHRTLYTCMFLALLFCVMLNVITGRYIYMYVFGFVILCYVTCNHIQGHRICRTSTSFLGWNSGPYFSSCYYSFCIHQAKS